MNSGNKRILFFCSFPPPNTGQTIATKLIYESLSEHYKIDVINIADEKRFFRKSGEYSFHVLSLMIGKLIALFKKLKRNKYNIVYVVYAPSVFSLWRDIIYTWIIKRLSNAKIIAHIHCGNYGDNFKSRLQNMLFNYLLNQVDKLIFLSPRLNTLGKIVDDKVVYLTNMISEDVVCNDEEIDYKIKTRIKADCFNIVFISNMLEEKGYADLLTAAQILKERTKQLFLIHFVGAWPSGDKKIAFINKVKESDMEGCVCIYDAVSKRERVKQFFLDADVFVLPTYYPVEAQPLSIIEAFNAATPVISTYHAAIPDMIKNGVNGFLVNSKTPLQIAEKIEKFYHRPLWEQMAKNARKIYKSTYHKDVIMPELLNIFDA